MTKYTLLFCTLLGLLAWGFTSFSEEAPVPAHPYVGAWEYVDAETGNRTVILTGNTYAMVATYAPNPPEFLAAFGGVVRVEGNTGTLTTEFHTADPDVIGTASQWQMSLNGDQLTISPQDGGDAITYTRVDQGNETDLVGVWRISGREREGKMTEMTWGARKTLKMCTGTRFQWAAFNPETKQFSGTGGGTYVLENGTYTEHIEFFSRDNSRVGMHLSFDAQVTGKEWDHSGLSSKGAPIHEIWKNVD